MRLLVCLFVVGAAVAYAQVNLLLLLRFHWLFLPLLLFLDALLADLVVAVVVADLLGAYVGFAKLLLLLILLRCCCCL